MKNLLHDEIDQAEELLARTAEITKDTIENDVAAAMQAVIERAPAEGIDAAAAIIEGLKLAAAMNAAKLAPVTTDAVQLGAASGRRRVLKSKA